MKGNNVTEMSQLCGFNNYPNYEKYLIRLRDVIGKSVKKLIKYYTAVSCLLTQLSWSTYNIINTYELETIF